MTILIHNSRVHVYKGPLPTHETNEYHPQTVTRFDLYNLIYFTTRKVTLWIRNYRGTVYKSHKRNEINHQEKCSENFCAKSKENLLLVKIYGSKNVNLGIEIQNFSRGKKTNQLILMSWICMNIFPIIVFKKTTIYNR